MDCLRNEEKDIDLAWGLKGRLDAGGKRAGVGVEGTERTPAPQRAFLVASKCSSIPSTRKLSWVGEMVQSVKALATNLRLILRAHIMEGEN